MAKMKTKRAAAKRFKVTATGKIKYKKAHLRHLLVNKSKRGKKDKGTPGYVNPGDYHNAAMCIPYLVQLESKFSMCALTSTLFYKL